MAASVMGTPVTSANPNTTTNTSLSVALATTTVGQLNIIEISGLAVGTTVNPTMATPAGWTKVGERLDTNGTPASFVAIYWRIYQSGDPSAVTISWTNTGQMVAVCTPWSGFDTTTPLPYSVFDFKVASDANYSIAGTTGTDAGLLCYGFANRTGAAWSALTDADRGQVGLASSATMVARVTAAEVAAGTAFTKSAVGSTTSVGVSWAYVVKGTAPAGDTGAVSVAMPALTASAAGNVSAPAPTPVDDWLALSPFYCAHRGGSDNWVEETAYAYSQASAWNADLALEFSTVPTSDGVWVGSHDLTADRVFGTSGYTFSAHPYTGDAENLRTTVDSHPLMLLTDFLDTYATGSRVVFVENKANQSTAFLDILDAHGGPDNIVVKMYYTKGAWADTCRARGYKSWAYYYQADEANIASTAGSFDILGMNYDATTAWSTILAQGKPVMGHIINSASAAATAFSKGADGLMVSDVIDVVPVDGAAGDTSATLPALAGSATAAVSLTATTTATLPSMNAAAAGQLTTPAAAAAALPAMTGAAAGALATTGRAAAALPPLASHAGGQIGSDATAAVGAVLPPLAAGVAGSLSMAGVAAAALPALALVGAGTLTAPTAPASGVLVVSLPSLAVQVADQAPGVPVDDPRLTLTTTAGTLTLTTPASTLTLTTPASTLELT